MCSIYLSEASRAGCLPGTCAGEITCGVSFDRRDLSDPGTAA